MVKLRALIGIMGAACLMLACSSSEVTTTNPRLICPEILIPKHTDIMVRFHPQALGQDLTDIDFQAGVGYLSGTCTIEEQFITMNFPILLEARKGPANTTNFAEVTLFAAVMTPDKRRLTQTALPYRLLFQGNNPNATIDDPITIEIPKRPDQTGRDFVVYIGLEMNREEINYNREQTE